MKNFCIGIALAMVSIAASSQDFDISKSWQGAIVHVPGNFFTKSVSNVEVEKPLPTILFMHGCTGIETGVSWAQFLKSKGYIVVMPDSFAMPGREKNCDTGSNNRNLHKFPAKQVRPAEAEYAMGQLKQQSWVDKNNIFLMGHSEGGMAAAHTPELGFNAVIISGFTCHDGASGSASTPVMAINFETDPWFANKNGYQCVDIWGDRSNAKQVLLHGSGHSTSESSEARNEVISFLRKHSK